DSKVNNSNLTESSFQTIYISGRELREVSAECLEALRAGNRPPHLFVRNGRMVFSSVDEKGCCTIQIVSQDYTRGLLTRSANFRKSWVDKAGRRQQISTNPPIDVVRDILALPPLSWGFPRLDSITGVPLIRPDGTVFDTVGYDPATYVVYTPA